MMMSNDGQDVQTEMPRYQCDKVVHALKIAEITLIPKGGGSAMLIPVEVAVYAPFEVSKEFVYKHDPHRHPGGYYVVYEDGYKSFSPAEAFEEGYTRMGQAEEVIDGPVESQDTFEKELKNLLNRHSRENGSDTPDGILAGYLHLCLDAFDTATRRRAQWYSSPEVQAVAQRAADASRHRRNGGI